MNNVKAEILKAFQGSKKLRITGYVSSKGKVADYEVELIGPEGYGTLIKKSHDYISNLRRPGQFSVMDWTEACDQQLTSWSIAPEDRQVKEAKVTIVPVEGTGYSVREDRPEAVVLQHLSRLYTTEEEPKVANHRDGVTAAKAWMRSNSPISTYTNMLILEPGKFQSVTAL